MRAESLRDMLYMARPLSSRLKAEDALRDALESHKECDQVPGTVRCVCGLTEAAAAFWGTVGAYSGCGMGDEAWRRLNESFVDLVQAYDTYEGTGTVEAAVRGLFAVADEEGLLSPWEH